MKIYTVPRYDTGVPRALREMGVAAADLDTLAADAMRQERLLVNNPCAIGEGDARRIYETAL